MRRCRIFGAVGRGDYGAWLTPTSARRCRVTPPFPIRDQTSLSKQLEVRGRFWLGRGPACLKGRLFAPYEGRNIRRCKDLPESLFFAYQPLT